MSRIRAYSSSLRPSSRYGWGRSGVAAACSTVSSAGLDCGAWASGDVTGQQLSCRASATARDAERVARRVRKHHPAEVVPERVPPVSVAPAATSRATSASTSAAPKSTWTRFLPGVGSGPSGIRGWDLPSGRRPRIRRVSAPASPVELLRPPLREFRGLGAVERDHLQFECHGRHYPAQAGYRKACSAAEYAATSSAPISSRAECMASCAAPTSTVGMPVRADVIGPIVEPHGRSARCS